MSSSQSSPQWAHFECVDCGRVLDDAMDAYCPDCQAAVVDDSDDDWDQSDMSYTSYHRVSLWARAVDPTPSRRPPTYISPSKRILSRQYPTACITSDSTISIMSFNHKNARPSPPRPAPSSPTATESLVASFTPASSLASFVRSWAPTKPHLPRLTTANVSAAFAKAQLLPSEPSSDGEVSAVWWLSDTTSPPPPSPRPSLPPRGRKPSRA
ncbi:hypothetical protein R3P38DRAFT_3266346 [Favolaschia claudopus]|uniref:Uncharacterized protein n=1 Tax=Favolaschia claudopus TaxID=2862362 RepID=A0AAW0BWE7_9AGAR